MAGLTEAEKKAAVATASSDLKLLLDRETVPLSFQEQLYHAGVVSVRQFAAFAGDMTDLKGILDECFGLKASESLAFWSSRQACARGPKMASNSTANCTSLSTSIAQSKGG